MYKQREIVLVSFPYSDLSSSKRRPVVIVSNNSYNQKFPDVLVCVVTSNLYKDDDSVTLKDSELESGILPEQSVIKCHKLFTIEQSHILKLFSTLSAAKFEEVKSTIQQLIQTSV
jgi:mRNA interferase MazF